MKIRILSFVLSLVLIYAGCVKPTSDSVQKTLFDWMSIIIDRIEMVQNDPAVRRLDNRPEDQQKYIMEKILDLPVVIEFRRNKSISFLSRERLTSELLYSLNENEFIIKKALYITNYRDKMYISYDRSRWYELAGINFDVKMEFDYTPDNRLADNCVIYSIAVTQKPTARSVTINGNRRVFNMEPDMLLANKDDEELSIDLKNNILLIPENTTITSELSFAGNLVVGRNGTNNAIAIRALRDMFIYINFPRKHISMSFDNQNWNMMIFSLKFSSFVKVVTTAENKIVMRLEGEINHQD